LSSLLLLHPSSLSSMIVGRSLRASPDPRVLGMAGIGGTSRRRWDERRTTTRRTRTRTRMTSSLGVGEGTMPNVNDDKYDEYYLDDGGGRGAAPYEITHNLFPEERDGGGIGKRLSSRSSTLHRGRHHPRRQAVVALGGRFCTPRPFERMRSPR
jgi:hypothetical protein